MRKRQMFFLGMLMVMAVFVYGNASAKDGWGKTFVLRDFLDRHWQNEIVIYEVALPSGIDADRLRLYRSDDKAVPVQIMPTASGRAKVAFKATVKPMETVTYRLRAGRASAPETEIKARADEDRIRLECSRAGIEVPVKLEAATDGPLSAVKGPHGKWLTAHRKVVGKKVESYSARVTQRGPVFAEARCRYTFDDGTHWKLRFRVIADSPVVLVDEKFDFADSEAEWHLKFGNSLSIPAEKARLAPWNGWWEEDAQAYYTLQKQDGGEALMVGVRRHKTWARPLPRAFSPASRSRRTRDVRVPCNTSNARMRFPFPENGRARSWMVGSVRNTSAEKLYVKYAKMPLNRVKDYVLQWEGQEPHPRLFVPTDHIGERDKRMKSRAAKVFDVCTKKLGERVSSIADKPYGPRGDCFIVKKMVRNFINWADLLLGASFVSPEEQRIMRARLAFIAYELARADRCSPVRGWSSLPNMTANWYGTLGLLSCLLSSHPAADRWFEKAYGEVQTELDAYVGPEGGWIEAPHYQAASLDLLIPFAVAARNAGHSELIRSRELKKTLRYLAAMSTPPLHNSTFMTLRPQLSDKSMGRHGPRGRRNTAPIGHTMLSAGTCIHGWTAKLFTERDPAFSRRMQWIWKQQGGTRRIIIGDRGVGFRLYKLPRKYKHYKCPILDKDLPAEPPDWSSQYFPGTGVVFRSGFPSAKETFMLFRQGPLAEHFDHDEGTFMLHSKGTPLVWDWGYSRPITLAPWAHNRMTNNHTSGDVWNEKARIERFAALGHLDYARGRQKINAGPPGGSMPDSDAAWPWKPRKPNGALNWRRHILFVRHEKPAKPNYFVIGDFTAGNTWAEWCAWLMTDQPIEGLRENKRLLRLKQNGAERMVVFFAAPARPAYRTFRAELGWDGGTIKQRLVHLAQRAGKPVITVFYPLGESEDEAPAFEAFADGRGVRVAGAFGRDMHIVADHRLEVNESFVKFRGKACSVQDRNDRLTLALPEGGFLAYESGSIRADGPVAVDMRANGRITIYSTGRKRRLQLEPGELPTAKTTDNATNYISIKNGRMKISLPLGCSRLVLAVKDNRWTVLNTENVTIDAPLGRFKAGVPAVQEGDNKLTLTLKRAGELTHDGYRLKADGPVAVETANKQHNINVYSNGLCRTVDLRVPGVDPEEWQANTQNIVSVIDGHLHFTLPQGWSSLRLRAPAGNVWPKVNW